MDFELNEEQKMFQKLAKDFADREIEPIAEEIEREAKMPVWDMLKKMADVGLLGIMVPEKYGGLGQGLMTYILALEQIHYSVTPCTWLLGSQGLSELFEKYGTEEQMQEYMPPVVQGKIMPSGAFTEPATGSDPRLFTTTAVLENGQWVINGVKRFATFGHLNGFALIYCKTDGDMISGIIVPKDAPGYTTSKPWGLMGVRGLETVDVFLRDVKVPEKNLVGERGKAAFVLMEMVAEGRLAIAIRSVAVGQRALDEAVKYAKERTTMKGPIAKMQGHQWLLAEMACRVEASRLLTYKAAYLKESHKPAEVAASIAKLFSGQAGEWVASQSLQIHGAYGYTTDYKIERIYRAAKQSQIAEGVNESQRTTIGSALVRD